MEEIQFQLRFLVMPDYIYSDDRLTDVSRRVYAFIHSYKNPFYFGNDHLAKMFKCHPDTISTAVKQLEELKLILTEYKTKAGGGKTRLCVDAVLESVSTPTRNKKTKATSRSLHPDKDISKENKKKEEIFLGENKIEIDEKGVMLNPATGIPYTASQLSEMRKSESWGNRNRSGSNSRPPYKEFVKKERTAAHGEHIV